MDQPNPEKGFGDMWDRIIKRYSSETNKPLMNLFKERREVGIKRYGVTLQAYNGRNSIEDLISELLDALAYTEQVAIEYPDLTFDMIFIQKNLIRDIKNLKHINDLKKA